MGVHGPGPYFDEPGPWTGSTQGVHVLYFPLKKVLFRFLHEQNFDVIFLFLLIDVSIENIIHCKNST